MNNIKMDINEIMKVLPHRYPFLLVDKIIEFSPGKKIVGIKNVSMNETFFPGHFPSFPVMPGVLVVEAMAQVGAILILNNPGNLGKLIYFTAIDDVRFRKPVVPGDQLKIEVENLRARGNMGKMKAVASVDGEIVAEGELMCAVVEKEEKGKKGVRIHPTAIVHPTVELGENVKIAPYVSLGEEVKIGDSTVLDDSVVVRRWTKIGSNCHIHQGASIGDTPQDIHYKGEKSFIEIGDRNTIREFATIHLASGEGAKTIVGDDNLLMVYSHVPHNAKFGNQIVLGGYVGIGGHAVIEDQAVIGGMAGIHQFVRIGRLAMLGGHSKIIQDVPPYMIADGNPAQIRGINAIGLQRRGVSLEAQSEIKKAFKLLYQSKLNLSQALSEIKKKVRSLPEISHLIAFLEADSKRGISRKLEEIEAEEAIDMILPEVPELGI